MKVAIILIIHDRVCVPDKTENANVNVFNMITVFIRINEQKTLAKHISCECKYKFHGTKCNSDQKWKNELCQYECKNLIKYHTCEELRD